MYAASCSTYAAISARGGTNRCPSCSHLFWKIHFQVNEQRADLFHKRWHRCDRWNKDQHFKRTLTLQKVSSKTDLE